MGILNNATTIELGTVFSNLGQAVTNVMNVITGNELLFTLFGASLMFTGVALVKKIKSASKR